MASTISARYNFRLDATEFLSGDPPPEPMHRILSSFGILDASSTIAATDVWKATITKSTQDENLDLTALADYGLGIKNFTGLKIKMILISGASDNTGTVAVQSGFVSNKYLVNGDSLSVSPGGANFRFYRDSLAAVSSSLKNLGVKGSSGLIYTIIIVAGT